MKNQTIAILAITAASFAHATTGWTPDKPTKPDVKTTPSKPDTGPKTPPSRAPQSRSDTVDRPCDRTPEMMPVWCRVLK